jgi:hypothetical protein
VTADSYAIYLHDCENWGPYSQVVVSLVDTERFRELSERVRSVRLSARRQLPVRKVRSLRRRGPRRQHGASADLLLPVIIDLLRCLLFLSMATAAYLVLHLVQGNFPLVPPTGS